MTEVELREFWAINYIYATPDEPSNHTLSSRKSMRVPVPNLYTFPYGSVGRLFYFLDGGIRTCTASLVENQYIYLLTAAHCMWSFNTNSMAVNMMFFLAFFDPTPVPPFNYPIGNPSYPGIAVIAGFFPFQWDGSNRAYDYGVIQVNPGATNAWLNPAPPTFLLATPLPSGADTLVVGYPLDDRAEYATGIITNFRPSLPTTMPGQIPTPNLDVVCTDAFLQVGASGGPILDGENVAYQRGINSAAMGVNMPDQVCSPVFNLAFFTYVNQYIVGLC